jgi:hypothetical protein
LRIGEQVVEGAKSVGFSEGQSGRTEVSVLRRSVELLPEEWVAPQI